MQGGGGEKPVPVDCISLLNLNWLISSPMAHVPKRARCLVILRMESQDKL